MTRAHPWMDERDLQTWIDWLALSTGLPAALHRDLQERSALSLQDYDVLVQLADAPDQRLRITSLARAVHWERSRLSHHVKRMAARGLVERLECDEDGRGSWVALTDVGRAVLERAAPGHAATVERLFLGCLDKRERRSLQRLTVKMLAHLRADPLAAHMEEHDR